MADGNLYDTTYMYIMLYHYVVYDIQPTKSHREKYI